MDYKEEKIAIEILIESDRLPEARELLNAYKLKYKNQISAVSLEALICILEADYQKAKRLLLKAYKNKNIDYDIVNELGMVSEIEGDVSSAIVYYLEAKEITKNDASIDSLNIIIKNLVSTITTDIINSKRHVSILLELMETYKMNVDQYLMEVVKHKYPKAIILETIRGCNLACVFCPLQLETKPTFKKHGLMTEETFANILSTVISTVDIKMFIMHNLGEPLLDRNISAKIKQIKNARPDSTVLVDSNLSLDFDAYQLVNSGLDILEVAFDGANQKSYSKYRVSGNLDKLLSNIVRIATAKRDLNSQKPTISAKTVIFKHVVDELGSISRLASQAGADNYVLQTAVFKEDTDQDPKEWIPEQQNLTRYDVEKLYKEDKLMYYKNSNYQGKDCSGILEEIPPVIDFEGNVYPCCYISTEEEFNMGNINKNSFKEIWESDKYANFRSDVTIDRFQYELCKKCCRPSNQA